MIAEPLDDYLPRICRIFVELGIPEDLPATRGLELCREPAELVVAETTQRGREFRVTAAAATAWHALKLAAAEDGIVLLMVSAFRSVDYQADIIRRKLEKGQTIDEILRVLAPPGYSEHHSGRAIDIGSDDCPELGEQFENTRAFRWLASNAQRFQFFLSFPRDNRFGYVYEPWHWCYRGDSGELLTPK
ncbi:M15 family metallopeptidase [Methylomonas rosea]|uniref:D-alanyl-D-alanine carboxypeptidase family protein n=1 Tax=Methylomonas rosea TaxID=2952227 RepID=A0ABT1U0G2_9GAMM|nr:M15 family metallopeptidase [Methylomonas sp. WSC-7]MCQ8119838.1 D-alanyl-D-alanine carboxypeptidase family protein [Methylomonas sp. WSC-7]